VIDIPPGDNAPEEDLEDIETVEPAELFNPDD
jgi:hypothetical protein